MTQYILLQPSTDVAMMAAYAAAGWRDVVVDLEHGAHSEGDVVAALAKLNGAGANLHLKLADLDPGRAARFHACGVRSFMLPHTESADDVRAIAEALRREADFEPAATHLFPIVESQRGLAALDAICGEAGVSGVHVGAIDLAFDLGFSFSTIDQLTAVTPELMPHVVEALQRIRANGQLNGCLFISRWRDYLPLDRLDCALIEIGQIVLRSRAASLWNA